MLVCTPAQGDNILTLLCLRRRWVPILEVRLKLFGCLCRWHRFLDHRLVKEHRITRPPCPRQTNNHDCNVTIMYHIWVQVIKDGLFCGITSIGAFSLVFIYWACLIRELFSGQLLHEYSSSVFDIFVGFSLRNPIWSMKKVDFYEGL